MVEVQAWSASDVERFLVSLELEAAAKVFRTNAVTGEDLLSFSDDDLTSLLGLTPLQIRKIRKALATSPTLAPVSQGQKAASSDGSLGPTTPGMQQGDAPPSITHTTVNVALHATDIQASPASVEQPQQMAYAAQAPAPQPQYAAPPPVYYQQPAPVQSTGTGMGTAMGAGLMGMAVGAAITRPMRRGPTVVVAPRARVGRRRF